MSSSKSCYSVLGAPYTSSPICSNTDSKLPRLQQRRSMPMDYRLLAGMKPKHSPITKHMKSDDRSHSQKNLNYFSNHRLVEVDSGGGHATKNIGLSSLIEGSYMTNCNTDSNADGYIGNHFEVTAKSDNSMSCYVRDDSAILYLSSYHKPETDCSVNSCSQVFEQAQHVRSLDHTYCLNAQLCGTKSYSITGKENETSGCSMDSSIDCDAQFASEHVVGENIVFEESVCDLLDFEVSIIHNESMPQCDLYGNIEAQWSSVVDDKSVPSQSYCEVESMQHVASDSSSSHCKSLSQSVLNINKHLLAQSEDSVKLSVPCDANRFSLYQWGRPKKCDGNDMKWLKPFSSIRNYDVDNIDDLSVFSFASERLLKTYTNHHSKKRRIKFSRSDRTVWNSCGQFPTKCSSSQSVLDRHFNLNHIKPFSEKDIDEHGLQISVEQHTQGSRTTATSKQNCSKHEKYKKFQRSSFRNMGDLSSLHHCGEGSKSFKDNSDSTHNDDWFNCVHVSASRALACIKAVKLDLILTNKSCYMPGCKFGCICRLFNMKRFRSVFCTSNLNKSNLKTFDLYANVFNELDPPLTSVTNSSSDSGITACNQASVTACSDVGGVTGNALDCESHAIGLGCQFVDKQTSIEVCPHLTGAVDSLSTDQTVSSDHFQSHLITGIDSVPNFQRPSSSMCESSMDQRSALRRISLQERDVATDQHCSLCRPTETADCQKETDLMQLSCSRPVMTQDSYNNAMPHEHTFRKQMLLFQHNQNQLGDGRPCLLEISSNCDWKSVRSSILSQLFSLTADSHDYPSVCKFTVDQFSVEIQPPSLIKTLIPVDLRPKLGISKMLAVRVRITANCQSDGSLNIERPNVEMTCSQGDIYQLSDRQTLPTKGAYSQHHCQTHCQQRSSEVCSLLK